MIESRNEISDLLSHGGLPSSKIVVDLLWLVLSCSFLNSTIYSICHIFKNMVSYFILFGGTTRKLWSSLGIKKNFKKNKVRQNLEFGIKQNLE